MNTLKDGRVPILLDRERYLLFDLNAMVEIEEKIGDISKLPDALNGPEKLKMVRWILTLLLNEGADIGEPQLTEAEVGKLINLSNFNGLGGLQEAIFGAISVGSAGTKSPPSDDNTLENDIKNAIASKAKK